MSGRQHFRGGRPVGPSRCLHSWLAAVAALAVGLAGCGERDRELAPVRGTVFHEGKPLAGGTIVFTPDPERGGCGPLAFGEIGGDGTFTLKTEDRPGAVPGWHRITVKEASPRSESGDGRPKDEGSRLPLDFSDPDRSGQRYEVQAGRPNVVELHLE